MAGAPGEGDAKRKMLLRLELRGGSRCLDFDLGLGFRVSGLGFRDTSLVFRVYKVFRM